MITVAMGSGTPNAAVRLRVAQITMQITRTVRRIAIIDICASTEKEGEPTGIAGPPPSYACGVGVGVVSGRVLSISPPGRLLSGTRMRPAHASHFTAKRMPG
jgi:hypothetical protein